MGGLMENIDNKVKWVSEEVKQHVMLRRELTKIEDAANKLRAEIEENETKERINAQIQALLDNGIRIKVEGVSDGWDGAEAEITIEFEGKVIFDEIMNIDMIDDELEG